MNGMVIIIIALVVILAIAAAAMISGKKSGEQKEEGGNRIRDLKVDAVEMKRKKEPIKEDPEVTAAKKDLYQYLTQVIKKMFMHYRRGTWNQLTRVNVPSGAVQKHYDRIRQSLTPQSADILDDFFSCIDSEGSEEKKPGEVRDAEKLRQVFLRMVLPFYPVYYDKLDGVRYTALLNQTMLNLFHRLTGKKFRLGYKNRYRSGVTAYRWEGSRYQVFEEDGIMLCDAVFRDGKVWEGFARLPENGQPGDKDWEMVKAGTFQEGRFVDGTLQYIYRKKCGQI